MNLSKRLKRIEDTGKKIQVQSTKNNFRDYNLYKKKVDALIKKFMKASISKNITDQINTASDKTNWRTWWKPLTTGLTQKKTAIQILPKRQN